MAHPTGGKGGKFARPARRTHKAARKAPNGVGRARELVSRLEQDAFRERIRFTEAEMVMLDRISSGVNLPRNAGAVLHAIELRASYAYARPKQELLHSGPDGGPVVVRIERVIVDPGKP